MEAIHCSFPSLPISSFLTTQHPTRGRAHLQYFLSKQRPLPSLSPPRPQALNEALNAATDVTPKAIGGDISVLMPVSALLLFMYWVANFIVPGIVAKDLQGNASSEREETVSEQQTSAASAANATAPSDQPPDRPKKKFKKEDIKKMKRR